MLIWARSNTKAIWENYDVSGCAVMLKNYGNFSKKQIKEIQDNALWITLCPLCVCFLAFNSQTCCPVGLSYKYFTGNVSQLTSGLN